MQVIFYRKRWLIFAQSSEKCRQHMPPFSDWFTRIGVSIFCHCLVGSLHCRQYLSHFSNWLATLSAVYATIVWLTRFTVGSILCYCHTDSLRCRQHFILLPHCREHFSLLPHWFATLSAAYATIDWLAPYIVGSILYYCLISLLHCWQHFATIVWLARYTIGSILFYCHTGSLHCRQPLMLFSMLFSDWFSTLSAAYTSIVWLARYTVGSIYCHCLTGSLHCRQHLMLLSMLFYNSLHCRQHILRLFGWPTTLSAAYSIHYVGKLAFTADLPNDLSLPGRKRPIVGAHLLRSRLVRNDNQSITQQRNLIRTTVTNRFRSNHGYRISAFFCCEEA